MRPSTPPREGRPFICAKGNSKKDQWGAGPLVSIDVLIVVGVRFAQALGKQTATHHTCRGLNFLAPYLKEPSVRRSNIPSDAVGSAIDVIFLTTFEIIRPEGGTQKLFFTTVKEYALACFDDTGVLDVHSRFPPRMFNCHH